jgi:hypothetical protein
MSAARKSELPPRAMMDPTLCHYCNKNKLDPKDQYFLPSGIEVCKECASRHGKGIKHVARPLRVSSGKSRENP